MPPPFLLDQNSLTHPEQELSELSLLSPEDQCPGRVSLQTFILLLLALHQECSCTWLSDVPLFFEASEGDLLGLSSEELPSFALHPTLTSWVPPPHSLQPAEVALCCCQSYLVLLPSQVGIWGWIGVVLNPSSTIYHLKILGQIS